MASTSTALPGHPHPPARQSGKVAPSRFTAAAAARPLVLLSPLQPVRRPRLTSGVWLLSLSLVALLPPMCVRRNSPIDHPDENETQSGLWGVLVGFLLDFTGVRVSHATCQFFLYGRHVIVIGCHLTREIRVQNACDDVASMSTTLPSVGSVPPRATVSLPFYSEFWL